MAAKVFAPCYIGGWSACEHWGLTEQIFRDVVIFTTRKPKYGTTTIQDTGFRIKHIDNGKYFGTRTVWRDDVKVLVSDPTKTIVDVLDEPGLGGGIRHVADMVASYFESTHRDERRLVEYGLRLGNRTIFKRLGFLIEKLGLPYDSLVEDCLALRSRGVGALDPSASRKGRILQRWGLRVNVQIAEPERAR